MNVTEQESNLFGKNRACARGLESRLCEPGVEEGGGLVFVAGEEVAVAVECDGGVAPPSKSAQTGAIEGRSHRQSHARPRRNPSVPFDYELPF